MNDLVIGRKIVYNSYLRVEQMKSNAMNTVKLGEKGQITLPKSVRETYQWSKGTQFRVVDQGDGIIAIVPIKPAVELDAPVFDSDSPITDEQINDAIAAGAGEEYQ